MCITGAVGLVLWYLTKEAPGAVRDREAFAAVGLCWLIIAVFGALPYVLSGTLPNFIDAYFESMSGFTTTGATLLDTQDSHGYFAYPHSIIIWRSLMQWLGGMGIIILSVVVLARIVAGGIQLYRAEIPGHTITRLKPKIAQTAALLWKIYVLFTIIEIGLLCLAGMSLFDSINHTFCTLATGGFSPRAGSIEAYHNPLIEIIIIVFMIIAGTSFVLHYHVLTGRGKALIRDPEFRFYILVMLFMTILLTMDLSVKAVYSIADSFRYAIFQAVSIQTTTGFTTANFDYWPASSQFIILILMFMGGCIGSTCGGMKIIRILLLLKSARRELQKVIHPRGVIPITLGGKKISDDVIRSITVFFFIYIGIFVTVTIVLGFMGLDILTSASAVAASLGNIGPGLGLVGPSATYAVVHPVGKIILALCMWLGRLEIFACLVIFFPSAYRT
jgi:trk system potassium uptake protein TrkH